MFKIGEWAMIINIDNYANKAAEILEKIEPNSYSVQTMHGDTLIVEESNLKRKKMCVCGQSGRAPFCDGSHSRVH